MPLEANFKKQIPTRGLLTFFTQYDDALQNFSFSQNNVKNLSMILTTHSAGKKKSTCYAQTVYEKKQTGKRSPVSKGQETPKTLEQGALGASLKASLRT